MADRSNQLLVGFLVVGAVTLSFFAGRRSVQVEMQRAASTATAAATSTPTSTPTSTSTPTPMFTVSASAIGTPAPTTTVPTGPQDAATLASSRARLDRETTALLDVRAALDKHDGPRALALLDKHDKDFPDGILGPDARMLRIEALAMAGKNADAIAQADSFLADFPHHPEAARIAAIRDGLKK